jgi:hypothetical protein
MWQGSERAGAGTVGQDRDADAEGTLFAVYGLYARVSGYGRIFVVSKEFFIEKTGV